MDPNIANPSDTNTNHVYDYPVSYNVKFLFANLLPKKHECPLYTLIKFCIIILFSPKYIMI